MEYLLKLSKVPIIFVPFLFSLCFHEFGHAWMALKVGDTTAKNQGRLTLNPLAHADILGTFILPISAILFGGILFGWAKPVPFNPRNLKNPKSDIFWIAFAGPIANLILVIISFIILIFTTYFISKNIYLDFISSLKVFLLYLIQINLMLALFNLIPLHPLDGGKILARFLPYEWNRQLEIHQNTLFYLLFFIIVFGGNFIGYPIVLFTNILVNTSDLIVENFLL